MKNIKTYLSLAVTIVFCASINTFAMEKERSDASGEWFDYQLGESNTSSEVDNDINILHEQLENLKNILNPSNYRAKNENITAEEFNQIKELLQFGQTTWNKIVEMISGHRTINTALIDQEISLIKSLQENIQEMNNFLLTVQINKLQDIINLTRNTLNHDKNNSPETNNNLQGLLRATQTTLKIANGMLLGSIPVDIEFIQQKIREIIMRWNNIDSQ
jgi:hypothetical protein